MRPDRAGVRAPDCRREETSDCNHQGVCMSTVSSHPEDEAGIGVKFVRGLINQRAAFI